MKSCIKAGLCYLYSFFDIIGTIESCIYNQLSLKQVILLILGNGL